MDKWFWIAAWCSGALLEGAFIYLFFQWLQIQDDIDNTIEVSEDES